MLAHTLSQCHPGQDMWVCGYASLIWRPEFNFCEQRAARLHGWHRALKMWSTVNRGTPALRGLVFALLSGGSCCGRVYRVPSHDIPRVLTRLWQREMPNAVYDPKWLQCQTHEGPVQALSFTLSRQSPSYTGQLSDRQYQKIFSQAVGRYGSTLDYALQTYACLREHGIDDHALKMLLRHADVQTFD